MIKVIAFDLVGVLVGEKNNVLNEIEDKLERLFGPNINDEDYIIRAKEIITDSNIELFTKNIINKLYRIREENLIDNLRKKYPNIKIIIATNHLSYVRDFINKNFDVDDVIISAEINKIKPNLDFYQFILDKYNLNSNELLFLDDNIENVESAKKLGINTIKVKKDMTLLNEIEKNKNIK